MTSSEVSHLPWIDRSPTLLLDRHPQRRHEIVLRPNAKRAISFIRIRLDRLSHRDRSGSTFSEAEYAGPWTVWQWRDGFAVLREADGDAGAHNAVFTERETALGTGDG